jgi:hypothetical protein
VIDGNLHFTRSINASINLDGIETITGHVNNDGCLVGDDGCPNPPAWTLSSTTLTSIGGSLSLGFGFPGLTNMSFPVLETIGGVFDSWLLENVTYLDITALSTVASFRLDMPRLDVLKHNSLRNLTGDGSTSEGRAVSVIRTGNLSSVDSLYSHPLDLQNSSVSVLATSTSMHNITFGIVRAGNVSIYGTRGDLAVILGGPNTTTMQLDGIEITQGVKSLSRAASLTNLSVNTMSVFGWNNFTTLDLSFDQLTKFELTSADSLTSLRLPSQAVDWTGFDLSIQDCPNLNLSNQFAVDAAGNRVQTWYWPKSGIKSIHIDSVVGLDFL